MKAEQKHWQEQIDIYYQASDPSKSLQLDMFYLESYDRLDTERIIWGVILLSVL